MNVEPWLRSSRSPMLIQTAKEPVYDAVVIGSGASGGMAAWNLTKQGARVLMLDAGTHFHRKDFWTHVPPYEWRWRGHLGFPAGRPLSPARAAATVRESAIEESCPARGYSHRGGPSCRLTPPSQWIRTLPLLRRLRPWLRHRILLQLCRSPHSRCSQVGPSHASDQRRSCPDTAKC